MRRISTTGRDLPKNTFEILNEFVKDCSVSFQMQQLDRSKFINMDETSIYLDFPSSYTYEEKGARRVKATTAGSERTRMSAAFTASASGEKLPIFIIIPRLTDMPDYTPPDNVIIQYKTGGTFNDDVVCPYLDMILSSKSESTIFIDSAKCHLTEKVANKFSELNLKKCIIPPRMTNLVQPADVSWFAKIKKELHGKWNHWYLFEDKTYTRFGNMR